MYANEKNCLILISLLKKHGIKYIVVSPGATNDSFVLSVQRDSFFRLFSAVDERHAAYLACGIAAEQKSPVVINCTGATASRNYLSALTEAYYRKLPVLAITCSQALAHLGNLWPQMSDRRSPPGDTAVLSVQCPIPGTIDQEKDCELKINQAILALCHHGGGPAHINLETIYTTDFSISSLPECRRMSRVMLYDKIWPEIQSTDKILIWIGSHAPFTKEESRAIDGFMSSHNAVLVGDQTSNCNRDDFVLSALVCMQNGLSSNPKYHDLLPDLIIHIGEISGDYPTARYLRGKAPVWRVNEDGELRDYLSRIEKVFEMPEECFFAKYDSGNTVEHSYRDAWSDAFEYMSNKLCWDMAFTNIWIASRISKLIRPESELHLGILNPIRCWNLFRTSSCLRYSNVGGFGIDGNMSTMFGASLINPDRLYIGVVGDLSFFYDLNSLGNRHIGSNVRILLVNNGEGGEFSVPHSAYDVGGEEVRSYIAAKGHFGAKSSKLVMHFATDLGFEYMVASSKEEFEERLEVFLGSSDRSIVLECFTDVKKEADAMKPLYTIDPYEPAKSVKSIIGGVLPKGVKTMLKAALKS